MHVVTNQYTMSTMSNENFHTPLNIFNLHKFHAVVYKGHYIVHWRVYVPDVGFKIHKNIGFS
jgi:hypothetical protein